MNFLDFIFKLLWQFISFEPGKFEELKEKAFAWRRKVEKETEDGEKKWYHQIIKYDNEWYTQVGLAIFFLFAVKSVRMWLLTDTVDSDIDEDDEDDEEDARAKLRAIKQAIPNVKF